MQQHNACAILYLFLTLAAVVVRAHNDDGDEDGLGEVVEVTNGNYRSILRSGIWLVYVRSSWSKASTLDFLAEVAHMLGQNGKIHIATLNASRLDSRDAARDFRTEGEVPSMKVFRDGRFIQEHNGPVPIIKFLKHIVKNVIKLDPPEDHKKISDAWRKVRRCRKHDPTPWDGFDGEWKNLEECFEDSGLDVSENPHVRHVVSHYRQPLEYYVRTTDENSESAWLWAPGWSNARVLVTLSLLGFSTEMVAEYLILRIGFKLLRNNLSIVKVGTPLAVALLIAYTFAFDRAALREHWSAFEDIEDTRLFSIFVAYVRAAFRSIVSWVLVKRALACAIVMAVQSIFDPRVRATPHFGAIVARSVNRILRRLQAYTAWLNTSLGVLLWISHAHDQVGHNNLNSRFDTVSHAHAIATMSFVAICWGRAIVQNSQKT